MEKTTIFIRDFVTKSSRALPSSLIMIMMATIKYIFEQRGGYFVVKVLTDRSQAVIEMFFRDLSLLQLLQPVINQVNSG